MIRLNKILLSFIIVVSFIVIFYFNNGFPLFADDWDYLFIYGDQVLKPVSGFKDILISQYNHYFLWGGRSIVHIIDQYLLILGNYPRAILKSIVFVIFVIQLYLFSNQSSRSKPILYFIIFSLVWLVFPIFRETMLWTTGVANYLFGMVILLFFIYPFYNFYLKENNSSFRGKSILFLFVGIIAGWTNENSVAAVIFLLISLYVYLIYKKKKIPSWVISGSIGLLIGFFIMILAPGNFVRVSEETDNITQTLSSLVSDRFGNVFFYYQSYGKVQFLLLLYFILLGLIFVLKRKEFYSKQIQASILFFISANVSSFAMLASPIYPERATFCMISFLIIANGILLQKLLDIRQTRFLIYGFSIVIFLLLGRKIYYTNIDITQFKEAFTERDSIISENIQKGNLNIVLTKKIKPIYFIDLSSNPDNNKPYAKIKGLESIQLIEKE